MKNTNINKHLIFEECINKGLRKYQIADESNKSQSTILREIRKTEFRNHERFLMKILLIVFILKIVKFILVNVNIMKQKDVIVEINLLVPVIIALILKSAI